MDIAVGDIIVMKKNHPCGCNRFIVLRIGVDFKIKCEKCGHEVMTPRVKIVKKIKNVIKENTASDSSNA
ncbi:hypothetical protein CCDG5_0439 [[Clostridium] cellulosi]|jgi:Bacterial protein of unknown function (DUF951).|uniref:DUF951 domain-containing protein n=1 Tax=[Clostridium] cellulosi TaxID=29343 RepID=A0A078KM34_9FIRM|nr:hypothetical protein CCDG5_0439 [[Clostridium] cellulosi]